MSDEFEIIREVKEYIPKESEELLQGSEDDIEYNKNLKEISLIFLKENEFDISIEPKIEDMDESEFAKYIENKSEEGNEIIEKLEELNVEINFRSLMSNIYTNTKGKRIFVFFLPTDKNKKNVGKGIVGVFTSLMFLLDCKEGLLISKKNLTSLCKDKIISSNVDPQHDPEIYKTIFYTDSEFLPICLHALTPKVIRILRFPDDVNKFIKDHDGINVKKFSILVSTDPLVKFYRGSTGDIFELERIIINEKNMLSTQKVFRIVTATNLKKGK
jgi:hypothetical protein